MWPIIIRVISGRCVAVGSRITVVEAISSIASNLPRFSSIVLSNKGQIARIIRKMADIKANNIWIPSFDLAKKALAGEKGIIAIFGNDFISCAEYFAALWEALINAKIIIIG